MPVVRGPQRPAGRKSARPVSGISYSYPQSDYDKLGIGTRIICPIPGKTITQADRKVVNAFAAYLAQKAAVEKTLARYFELTCGHYGTREADEFMRDWKTKRLEHFCDTCNTWKLSKQNFTKGNELPQEPLF